MTTLQDTPPSVVEAALDVLTQMQRRVIQDAFAEASAAYWKRRAAQFEAARPRDGEYLGRAGVEAREASDRRCAAVAAACRAKAAVTDQLWAGERRILDEAGL